MFTQKFIKIFHSVQEIGPFSLVFRIRHSAKPRPIINVILQFPGLDQHQIVCKILSKYSKWFKGEASLFSEFEPRQILDQSQMSFDNLIGYILSIPMCRQNFITLFHSVQEIGPFSLFLEFGARQNLNR